jgi:arylformamidase
MDLIDISRPLSPATAVWPGDQPVERTWTTRLEEGDAVNLSAVQLSVHAGTHVDAPFHVRNDGDRTGAMDLSVFVGPAEVVEVAGDTAVRPRHVKEIEAPRVLFKTEASALSSEAWPDAVTAIHPEAIAVLDEQGVCLIGTDAPSVDPLESTDLPAHHALIDAGILNLEGLTLAGVESGPYTLLSFPIKLPGGDAAPVRAVLGDASLL